MALNLGGLQPHVWHSGSLHGVLQLQAAIPTACRLGGSMPLPDRPKQSRPGQPQKRAQAQVLAPSLSPAALQILRAHADARCPPQKAKAQKKEGEEGSTGRGGRPVTWFGGGGMNPQ